MKLLVQETRGAYGLTSTIPESAWRTISEHRKVATARAAKRALESAMRERCGSTAWDSHRRIVNAGVLPVKLTATWLCLGTYQNEYAADCEREKVTELFWQPGEPEPAALSPEGWWSGVTCGACRRIDAAREAREFERWEREQAEG
jgi:hypothetical protein